MSSKLFLLAIVLLVGVVLIGVVLIGIVLVGTVLGLAIFQALHLKKNAIRLPEAEGKRYKVDQGELSILHVGESPVAGVGVAHIDQGFTANVVEALSGELKQRIDWEVLGSNGITAAEALSLNANMNSPDILILSFGVNDTTAFTSSTRWVQSLKACVERFAGEGTKVVFTSVPNMQKFPLLPTPLNWLLGARVSVLNKSLKALCKEQAWGLVESDVEPNPELMAEDGYHPNAAGYEVWGKLVAGHILTLR